MTLGVGGVSAEQALAELSDMTQEVQPIAKTEFLQRIEKAQGLMKEQNIAVTYLNAGTNLYYFTGTNWYPSERLVGALLFQTGEPVFIAPHFEVETLKQYQTVTGPIISWHEHDCPYLLVANVLANNKLHQGTIAIDESTPFFIANGIKNAAASFTIIDAKVVTAGCRMTKSPAEIALMQTAKTMTLAVQRAAAKILKPGITTKEVTEFIDKAHRKVGAANGSYFCIVLFGEDTAYPHGVKTPKCLAENDMVLIDTGCQIEQYHSDITRTYVFGVPTEEQRQMWQVEKSAQLAAFDAAELGAPCANADLAARDYLASQGLGPDYQTPGCPHRTGHGIGLDIHEWPYLVKNNQTALLPGMTFSNEPMLVIPNKFGIRLEDHFYMTDKGPKWFTEPSYSIDDPFGYHQNQ